MKIEAGSLFEGRFHAAKIERQMTALPLAAVHIGAMTLKVKRILARMRPTEPKQLTLFAIERAPTTLSVRLILRRLQLLLPQTPRWEPQSR